MGKAIKWLLISMGSLVLLVIVALLVIPMFVNVEKYKPEIEKQASQLAGRPVRLGGELDLSLFPWAGLSFSDVHLGNPPGFESKDMVSVESCEARVKLLPLLSREVEAKFIMKGPRIALEMDKGGRGNWEGLGKPSDKTEPSEPAKAPESEPAGELPVKSLRVEEFAISDGSVLWIDHAKKERKEVSDVNLRLDDVSFDEPISLSFSAKVDGKPVSLEGKAGPVGKDPGKGAVPVDLVLKALDQLNMAIRGKVQDVATRPAFDVAVNVSSFSPRKLMAALDQAFPVETADPEAFNEVSFWAKITGDAGQVTLSDGGLTLDDSKLTFTLAAKEFEKPKVAFNLQLNQIDADRYLPPSKDDAAAGGEDKAASAGKGEKTPIDYGPLRKIVVDGTVQVAKLKVHGANVQDISLKLAGRDGVFRLDPLSLGLYRGNVSGNASLNVQQSAPKSAVKVDVKGVQAGPLLKDVLKIDKLEGTATANLDIAMTGDEPDTIKKTLSGNGELLFEDGAIVGIDLANMVRNVETAFGLSKQEEEKKPRTDFAALTAPFTLSEGVFNTPNSTLMSPLIRLSASGTANLVNETLDFRIEPKVVATIKGQGDTMERSGLMVPVLVTGTFSSPVFRPDLKGVMTQTLEGGIPTKEELEKKKEELKKKLEEKLPIPSVPSEKEGEAPELEEKAKDMLKGFGFGQ